MRLQCSVIVCHGDDFESKCAEGCPFELDETQERVEGELNENEKPDENEEFVQVKEIQTELLLSFPNDDDFLVADVQNNMEEILGDSNPFGPSGKLDVQVLF